MATQEFPLWGRKGRRNGIGRGRNGRNTRAIYASLSLPSCFKEKYAACFSMYVVQYSTSFRREKERKERRRGRNRRRERERQTNFLFPQCVCCSLCCAAVVHFCKARRSPKSNLRAYSASLSSSLFYIQCRELLPCEGERPLSPSLSPSSLSSLSSSG